MYCKKCGKIVMDGDICPECAAKQNVSVPQGDQVIGSVGEQQNPGNANPQVNSSPLVNGGGNYRTNTEEKLKRTFWEWVILFSAGFVFAIYVLAGISSLEASSTFSIAFGIICVILCAIFGFVVFSYAFIQAEACRNARSANNRCDQLLELYFRKFPNQNSPFDMRLKDLKYSPWEITIIVFGCVGSGFCALMGLFSFSADYGLDSIGLNLFSGFVYFLICAVLAVILLASTFVLVQLSRGARLTNRKCSLLFDELNKADH